MNASLSTFVAAMLGQPDIGDTPQNSGQCVGLVERWLDANNLPHVWGNAVDLLANAPTSIYKVVPNGPSNAPQPGDVVVWGQAWGGGFGHTAVVIAANANLLAVLEQNNPTGAPCTVATHGYSGVIGWLQLPTK
jgi:CHAP domain